jgi:hypothetical protein
MNTASLKLDELQYVQCDLSDVVLNPIPRMTPYGEQDDNGVDVSLIRSNLRLSPADRIRQNRRASAGVVELHKYARRIK